MKWQFLKLQLQRHDCQQSNHQICFKLWSIHFTIFYHKLVFGIEKNSNTTAMKVNIFLYIQNSLSKKGKYSLNMASPSILLKIKLASVSKLRNLCYWTWSIVSCMEENLFFPRMKRFKARIKRKYWNWIEATYHL